MRSKSVFVIVEVLVLFDFLFTTNTTVSAVIVAVIVCGDHVKEFNSTQLLWHDSGHGVVIGAWIEDAIVALAKVAIYVRSEEM